MKSAVIIVAYLFLLVSKGQAAQTQSSKFDPAYLGNVTCLYDQSGIIESDAFKSASDAEKQTMLVDEFLARKDSQYTQILMSYWWTTIPVGIIAAHQLFAARAPAGGAPANAPGLFAAASAKGLILATLFQPLIYLFMNPLTAEIEKFGSVLLSFSSSKLTSLPYFKRDPKDRFFDDELDRAEREYITHKREISRALWQPAEFAIAKARSTLSSSIVPSGKSFDVPVFIRRILSLPRNVKPLQFDLERTQKEFEGYDLDSKDALLEFCLRFISASLKNSPVNKIPLYFYGPAGVGKTEAARRLAKILDVTIGEVSLEKVTHINDLIGWPKDHPNAGPGLIAEAMIKANKDGKGSKNMILLADEADRMLNQVKYGSVNELVTAFLKLLESKTGSYYNPYFDADIEIDQISFTFIGNSTLKDKALRNRFHSIEFKGFVPGYKASYIITEYVPQLLKQDFADPVLGLSEELSDTDWRQISEMTNNDKDPGFRTIFLNVRRFLEHKVLTKQFGHSIRPFALIEFDAQDRSSP